MGTGTLDYWIAEATAAAELAESGAAEVRAEMEQSFRAVDRAWALAGGPSELSPEVARLRGEAVAALDHGFAVLASNARTLRDMLKMIGQAEADGVRLRDVLNELTADHGDGGGEELEC